MKKLNIGIIGLCNKPIPPRPGQVSAPNQLINDLVLGLKARGHNVLLFTGTDSRVKVPKYTIKLPTPDGYNPDLSEVDTIIIRTQLEAELTSAAISMLKAGELDLVHCHDYRLNPYLFSAAGQKALYTVHGRMASHSTPYDLAKIKHMRENGHGFTVISRENIDFCNTNKLPIFGYVPNGVNIGMFKLGRGKRKGLLVVTRMIKHKMIKETIDIADKLKQDITLIGPAGPTDDDKRYFNDLEKNYFNRPGVKYLGPIDREKLVPYYQSSQVMIYQSLGEGIPMGILEAQACGLPVVASNIGGIADAIIDGETGYLVGEKARQSDWIVKINRAIETIIPEKCRENIVTNFSMNNMVDRYEQSYYNFVNNKEGLDE